MLDFNHYSLLDVTRLSIERKTTQRFQKLYKI